MIEQEEITTVEPGAAVPQKPKGVSWIALLVMVLIAAVGVGFIIFTGLTSRARASTELAHVTESLAIPTVSVVKPVLTQGAQEVTIPGNMQAFIDTPIWDR